MQPRMDSGNASPDALLATARRVFDVESAALAAVRARLDGDFTRACQLILNTQGRVVCTGMGKSGHIARKIAATLASTGTPAFYVHPGEAGHGDLGMITDADIVLALSNSGETGPAWIPAPLPLMRYSPPRDVCSMSNRLRSPLWARAWTATSPAPAS